MMKKTSRILLLILSNLALLVSVTASASAQRRPNRFPPFSRRGYFVNGTIRWKKDMGVVPMGPGNSRAAVYPCSAFSVVATDPGSGKAIVYTDQVASPFQLTEEGDYYVCRYSLKVPPDRNLYMIATMGGVLLLPKEDDSPMYLTDAWIGGNRSKPPARAHRTFTGYQSLRLGGFRSRAAVNFELIYAFSNDPK